MLVINLMINEDSMEVSGTTKDNISEPRQVGQESGISTRLCVWGWSGWKERQKIDKTSPLLNIGRKSSGWAKLLYSLPFAVPTHSSTTAVKINVLFLVCEKYAANVEFQNDNLLPSVSVCA